MKIRIRVLTIILFIFFRVSLGDENKIRFRDCAGKYVQKIFSFHDSICVVFLNEIRLVCTKTGGGRILVNEKYPITEAKIFKGTIYYLLISHKAGEGSQRVIICKVGDTTMRDTIMFKAEDYSPICVFQTPHSFSLFYHETMNSIELNPKLKISTSDYSQRYFRSNFYTDIKNGTLNCLMERYIKHEKNNGLSYLIVKGNQMQEIPIDSIVKANMYFLVYTISKVYKNIVYLQDSYPGLKEDKWMYRFIVGNKKTTFKKSKKPVNDTFLTSVDDNCFYFTRQFDNENIIEISIIKKSDLF